MTTYSAGVPHHTRPARNTRRGCSSRSSGSRSRSRSSSRSRSRNRNAEEEGMTGEEAESVRISMDSTEPLALGEVRRSLEEQDEEQMKINLRREEEVTKC